jgi:hypothetical protein
MHGLDEHKDLFGWTVTILALLLALANSGPVFIGVLLVGTMIGVWPLVFALWYFWKVWDDNRNGENHER